MRLDHIAWRVKDRKKTAQFFIDAFGYKIQDEFEIKFDVLFEDVCIGDTFEIGLDKYIKVAPNRAKTIQNYYYTSTDTFDPKKIIRGVTAQCIALEPLEKVDKWLWKIHESRDIDGIRPSECEYHMAPEIFVSDGEPDSIVGKWVYRHGNGIHHIAYQVNSVEKTVELWKSKGWAEFSSDVIRCPGITQVFTKPSELTGVIFEFIERGDHGFCKESVKQLMESTK